MIRHTCLVLALASSTQIALSQGQNPARPGNASDVHGQVSPTATRASPGASVFYLLMVANSEQRPTFWAEMLRDTSLTPEEIVKLRASARSTVTANLEFQKRDLEKVCAGKDALTTVDAVAAALTKLDVNNRANIEQLGKDAAKALGDRLGKLVIAAAGRSSAVVTETDHKTLMTAMKKDPVEHIRRICSKSTSSPGR